MLCPACCLPHTVRCHSRTLLQTCKIPCLVSCCLCCCLRALCSRGWATTRLAGLQGAAQQLTSQSRGRGSSLSTGCRDIRLGNRKLVGSQGGCPPACGALWQLTTIKDVFLFHYIGDILLTQSLKYSPMFVSHLTSQGWLVNTD